MKTLQEKYNFIKEVITNPKYGEIEAIEMLDHEGKAYDAYVYFFTPKNAATTPDIITWLHSEEPDFEALLDYLDPSMHIMGQDSADQVFLAELEKVYQYAEYVVNMAKWAEEPKGE